MIFKSILLSDSAGSDFHAKFKWIYTDVNSCDWIWLTAPRPSQVRIAIIIYPRIFLHHEIPSIRRGARETFFVGQPWQQKSRNASINKTVGSAPPSLPPALSLFLTEAITIARIFRPRWKMDESAGWCVSKRSPKDLRGWDPAGSLRAAVYETGVRNLPEPESVSSSAYQRTAHREARNARGMRFNSGAFPSSRWC